jgi:hypothetical protein
MKPAGLREKVQKVTGRIAGLPVDAKLEALLNAEFPAEGEVVKGLAEACSAGIAEGWLCTQGSGSRRFGRIFEPADDLSRYSVDVVQMEDAIGGHHTHPQGEIVLVMPVTPGANFLGHKQGWVVYPAGSGHRPAVSSGRAVVLYMLPEGRIEWTKAY